MKKPFSKLNLRPWLVWRGDTGASFGTGDMVVAVSKSAARYRVAKWAREREDITSIGDYLKSGVLRVCGHKPYLDDKMKSILRVTCYGVITASVNNRYVCTDNFSVNFMVSEGLMFSVGASTGKPRPDGKVFTNYRCTIFGMRTAGLSRREIRARVTMYGDS